MFGGKNKEKGKNKKKGKIKNALKHIHLNPSYP
jgi:hypothetical protein